MQHFRTLLVALFVLFFSQQSSAQSLTPASNIQFTGVTTTSFTISWTIGSGVGRMAVLRASPNGVQYPTDYVNYTSSPTFGFGSNINSGANYVVYKGTGSSVTVTNLSPGTYYTVAIYEYLGTSSSPDFDISPYGSGSRYTLSTQPTTQCTNLAVTSVGPNGATLTWTQGSGSRELVTLKYATTNTNTPSDGTEYYASSSYGTGDPVGSSPYSYAVYDNTGSTVTISNCATSSNFTAAAFTYDGVSGGNNYLTTSAPTVGFTTLAAEPTASTQNLSVRDVEDDAMTISWANATSGGGTYHLVLMNSTSANDYPVDMSIYTASSVYGSGSLIGNSRVVYNGTGNAVRVTNLQMETSYRIYVFDYNGGVGTFNNTTNYYLTSYPLDASTNTTHPGLGASSMSFTSVTPTSLTVNFTAGGGQARTVTARPGRRPTSLAFDGTNDHVVVPYNSALQPTAGVTLEAWVYRSSWTSSTASQYVAGNGESGGYCIFQSGTYMYFYVYRNGAWGTVSTSVTHLTPGWHHFAVTYDGRYTRGLIDAAVYGINDAGANYPIGYTWANAFIIGADVGTGATASGSYFSGIIDEVRVWNYAVLYWNLDSYRYQGLHGSESGLVGLWRFDDGMAATSTATNYAITTNSLNGTLTNMTTAAATTYTATSGWAWSRCPVTQPVDFNLHSAGTAYGNGQMLGYGNFVMANTTGSSVSISALSPNQYYTFTVTEYDENGYPYYNYDTPNHLVGETMTGAQAVPVITNMNPTSGSVGTLVTLTGTGFSSTTTDNIVYFGPTRATVSSASPTQLQVVVPYGANNTPVSVQVYGLTGTYTREFVVISSCANAINASSFTNSTQATFNATYGHALRDQNADGKSDVAVANYNSSYVQTFYGQSVNGANPPTFTSNSMTTPTTNPYFVEVGDLDGDGKGDLVYTTTTNYSVYIYRGSGSGYSYSYRWDLPLSSVPSQLELADFDGDGKLDIAVGFASANLISVFRNTSSVFNLSFAARQDIAMPGQIYAFSARDVDLDGKADIVAGQYNGTNFFALRSTGTPGSISFAATQTFATTAGANVYALCLSDFNQDGDPDLAVGCSNNTVRIYNNTSTVGTINFTYNSVLTTLASSPYSITANDFDGDGRHDLAVGYGSANTVSFFEAVNNFTFAARVDIATAGSASVSLSSTDFNQDGKADLVASTAGSTLNILTNDLDPLQGEPTVPASSLTVTGQTQTSMTLNFTAGNGFNRIVVVRQGSAVVNTPFDGTGYAANTVFGSGANLGGNTYCVYNGTGNSVTVTGLTSNTQYYFAVYEYNSNGSACTNNYLLTPATTSSSTLNTPPTLNAIANPSPICQSSGLQTVNFSGVGTGSGSEVQTLSITATSNNTGLIPNPTVTYTSPNANGSLSYTPVPAQYGTAVITVTVNDGAANNNTTVQTFTVTVTQQPTVSNAGPDQTICISTATLAANTPAVGTGTWSVVTSNCGITTGNLGNVNTPNTTLNGLTAGCSATLRWTITSGTCTPSFDDVVITRGSCPLTAGFTWSPSTICATPAQINNISFTDQSFAPSSTITSWSWTFSGPTTPNPTSSTQQNPANIQFTGPGTFTVSLTINDNVGGNSSVTQFITINPYPSAAGAITGTATVCQGQTLVPFSVGAIANATTYNWTLPSGATIVSGAGTNSILVDFSAAASSGFIQVQGQNSCGVGASSTPFNVTVNPLPGATSSISGPLSVCQGQTGVVYSTTSIPFATSYQWTLPPGATIVGSPTGSTITVDFAANASGGSLNVIGINSCGSGSSSVGLTISINPLPDAAGIITGPVSVCEGATGVVYTVPSIVNASTYNWTLPPGVVITGGAGTNSITTSFANATGSGTVTVTGVNSCGSGTNATLAVNVTPLPDSSTAITGPATVCAGTNGVQYSVTAIPGAQSYNWSVPAGATIVLNSGNSITVDFSPTATSGLVTVYGTNLCGDGAQGPGLSVTVNPLPAASATISGPATVCQGDSGVVFSIASVANANIYVWTLPFGATISTGDSTNSITVDFALNSTGGPITVIGQNGCGDGESTDTLNLVVNPLPDAAGVISGTTNIPICPAATGIVFTVPVINNATSYNWTLPAGATIVAGSGTNSITVDFTSNATPGAVIVEGVNGCGSGVSSFLNLAVASVTPIDICMVTVDSISQYNRVIWDKPLVTDIDSFRIHREITTNNFVVVGTVHYDSLSLFVDSAFVPFADPNATFQRYKISAIDSCGNESAISAHHRTLFMQANVGVSGEANLNWTLYEGQSVDYYRILRDSTLSGNWEVIDSVPGSNFVYTDWNVPTTVTQCRYRIQTVWSTSCSPTRNIITSESNLEELIVNGVNDHTAAFVVETYPNPTNGAVTVVHPANNDGVTFEVRDALGRVVLTQSANGTTTGTGMTQTTIDMSGLANGVYTLTVLIGEAQVHQPVILQK